MADKIKSFFQKKVSTGKFKNAGKGYKLSDTPSAAVSSRETREVIQRVEPTEEAKIAGQVTLARLEAKKKDITKFNASYAAVQARVKRELEKERKAQEEAQKLENMMSKKETKDTYKECPFLAVTGVYFRCPYLSEEVLTRDEWKKKIREFLYDQLNGDEAGLTACLIIQSCNNGKEKIDNCVDTLGKYLENIINNPDVEKYRKIRMSNRIFQEKVLSIDGALEFLKAAGFEKKSLLNNDVEEDFLVWNPENCTIEDFTMLSEALKAAEPIPLELDRNLQVILPQQARDRNELPPHFFRRTPEEIQREQQIRTEAVERSQVLRTKAMREKDEQRELRNYKFSLIRIKFPDSIMLQGTFSVHEKFENVVNFVSENLVDSEEGFTLKLLGQPDYKQDCFDKTLLELRLVPTTLLIVNFHNTNARRQAGYLKEEVLCLVQNT